MSIGDSTLEAAEQIAALLSGAGVDSVVIGGAALAAHKYVRATDDLDLATCTNPFEGLTRALRAIRASGFTAELRLPDADDPLGGVVDVTGAGFKLIQIVNFLNPYSPVAAALGSEAIERAECGRIDASRLKVVALPHLIALKLYAGGPGNERDVIKLLERNQPLDLTETRAVCTRYGLAGKLDTIVAQMRLAF